jgi:hypothetical protein
MAASNAGHDTTAPRTRINVPTRYLLLLVCSSLLIISSEAFSTNNHARNDAASSHERREVPIEESLPASIMSDDQMSRRSLFGAMAAAGLVLSVPGTSKAYDYIPVQNPPGLPVELLPTSTVADATTANVDWDAILQKASKKALGGGKAGASAAVVQVLCLMWLRTSMNRQYRYGGDLKSSLTALWNEGGIPRLYQGLPFALVQGPLTRFGDTAANVGILSLLESLPETQALPLPIKTAIGSIAAGTWRIILMPIDASKTAMQVEGADGLKSLWSLAATEGPSALYQGAVAQAAATAVGHFRKLL